jgi:pimeloyl-ACP methyl ester carboxylesterase
MRPSRTARAAIGAEAVSSSLPPRPAVCSDARRVDSDDDRRKHPRVAAVVSSDGYPDLAGPRLGELTAPVLLLVGGNDDAALRRNRDALRALPDEVDLDVIPGATHLFDEPGALDRVAELAGEFFLCHFAPSERD